MSKEKPNIKALVVLHSYGEGRKDFEILEISFPEENHFEECKEFETLDKKENRTLEEENRLKYLINMLCEVDGLMEMATEDVGEHGDISVKIHKELWEKNKEERFYFVNINLYYTSTIDYFGEVDTDVNYDYNLSTLNDEWKNLDLIQKGSKIYNIDYEDTKKAYVVMGVSEVCNSNIQNSGIYYNVQFDEAAEKIGFFNISDESLDVEGSKFYSSKEKAHEAYEKIKNKKET